MNSYKKLEKMIPEEYKITIGQVIKNCKLKKEQFKKEINFTRDQHTKLEEIHKEYQKKYYYPEYVIADKRIKIIHGQNDQLEVIIDRNLVLIQKEKSWIKEFQADY